LKMKIREVMDLADFAFWGARVFVCLQGTSKMRSPSQFRNSKALLKTAVTRTSRLESGELKIPGG
jgi:hypothetical protein